MSDLILSAKDAYDQTIEVIEAHILDDILKIVANKIGDPILSGKTTLEIKHTLLNSGIVSNLVEEMLQKKGYTASVSFTGKVATLYVSWFKPPPDYTE